MITAYFSGDKIISSSPDAFSLYEKSNFGEKKQNKIEYSPIESLFLLEERKISILIGKKELSYEELIKKVKKIDKRIEQKYAVYKDLRQKGYIVKSALKFGTDFRVYQKGVKPGQDHAKWILYVAKEHDNLNWHDFTAKNRVAHSTKKNLLMAVIDEEGDILYYEIAWTRP